MSNPHIEATYGLSPAQEGMLFHSVLETAGGFYVTQLTCGVRGADPELLVRAWQEVVNRHPIFRTAFAWKNVQKPLQVVGRKATLPVMQEDWRGRAAGTRAAALEAWLEEDRRKGFDLARAPLMRLALLRTGDAEWTLVWTHHHLLLDGWSLPRVLREVGEIYAALRAGRTVALPAPRPYGDYIAWLGRQDLREAEIFWREFSSDVNGATVVPAGESGARRAASVVWGEAALALSVEETAALQALARTERLTLNTIVQGAWAWTLAAATGERDVVYGVTVSGRPAELPGVEEMIGLFINTLPMRARLEPAQTVAAWLAGLQARLTELRRFEHTPLVRVGGWAGLPAGQALFEALFVFENYPVGETPGGADGSGADFEIVAPRVLEKTNYPLTLVAAPSARLALKLAFDPARYDAPTAERLLARLGRALCALPGAAARPLGELELLTTAERGEILAAWNRTAVTWTRPLTVPALFAEIVARAPGATAVLCDGRPLTFAELDTRADALAERLRASGVRRGALVGICLERSLEMIVALVAVLKAGGAYVPLDPTFPAERIGMMLEDARPRVVLTQTGLRESVKGAVGEILCVDDMNGGPLRERRDDGTLQLTTVPALTRRATGSEPADLAYVLFTSGSTGRPKGVQVSHGALANVLLSFAARPGFGAGQTLLAVTTLSFDIAGLEIFLPLITGGRLLLATREVAADGARLAAEIARENVDVLQATPATWRLLVAADFRPARRVQAWCGGEALPLDLAGELVARGCELWNVYGPTETTIWSLLQPVPAADAARSIGRAIANTTVYIVDDAGNPVPVGATGELLIGGAGVAEGYLGRADLTAEKFVPDAFGGVAGARLYRTGDRARWRADGTVEFLGRGDHQVKIRGFRIELGDIEAALRRHPAVREVAVIVREDAPGEKRLVAYVVTGGAALDAEAGREFLRGVVPDYMIPAAWLTLERLPLTPNRKLDRRALPAPEAGARREFVAPRTADERIVAAIWRDVLGVAQVGATDDFFALGGHSLTAMQVMARVRKERQVELPVRRLFESPVLAEFAASLASAPAVAKAAAPSSTPAPASGEPSPLSFAQQRMWVLAQLEPAGATYNLPIALAVDGDLDLERLRRALAALCERHTALRAVFPVVEGQVTVRIERATGFELPLIDLTTRPEAERESEARRLAAAEAATGFSLEQGPLVRARVVRLAPRQHWWLITVHHIVTDAWSNGLLVRDLVAFYTGSAPASRPSDYGEFARWQRRWLAEGELARQLDYWKNRLAGVPALELPTDRPRPAVQTTRGDTIAAIVAAPAHAALVALARREGATLFMTLLAAWEILLQRHSGQDDFAIGTPVAGRTRAEHEGMVGLFVNTLVLRADVAGDPTFAQLLGRVRTTTLDAFARQDAPFEQVVEAVRPPRDLSRAALFQVMFALQNKPPAELTLPGLTLTPVMTTTRTAKFDVTLTAIERRDGALELTAEYNTDLFETATIAAWLQRYTTLLAGIVAQPRSRVSALPVSPTAERAQLAAWSTAPAPMCAPLVPNAVLAQAARTPRRVALSQGDETMSYADMVARADAIAARLAAVGVKAETPVAVMLERSVDLVCALLGIWRAGGAYVPIDPEAPRDRVRAIAEENGIGVVITSEALRARWPVLTGGQVVCVETIAAAKFTPAAVDGAQLAYVLFTSGSTGRPKGVAVSHAALANHMAWFNVAHAFTVDDVVLQKTAATFDASVWEFWAPLLTGGRLELAAPGAQRDPAELAGAVQRAGVTVLQVVPTLLSELVAEPEFARGRSLRILFSGGEALTTALRDACAAVQRVPLVNLYGPTEATIECATWRCGAADGAGTQVPIGRAAPGCVLHVLDGALQPVPPGVRGELFVGGAQLARGYWRQPALTAAAFVPDPFSREPGARLYRTGDLVRWRADGVLEYLGRGDAQVKVRGFRVELGEIEAMLAAHPDVRECIVVVRGTGAEARLAAYVVARAGATVDGGTLREWARAKLPDYMVPAAVVELAAMPLLSNGKLDRAALPEPAWGGSSAVALATGGTPRSPEEEMLAESWREVLGGEAVGIRENFFERGGQSLLAARVMARVRRTFGVDLPLRVLFEAPTIEGLAARIRAARAAGDIATLPPFETRPADVAAQLSFPQERLWFLEQLAPGRSTYHMPVALRLRGRLDIAALARSLGELVRRHEALRTVFRAGEGGPVQVVLPAPENFALGAIAGDAIAAEVRRPFALGEDLPIRARLVTHGPEEHTLVVVMHHLVSDGWSIDVIVRELGELYAAALAGRVAALPALPRQYADFAAWQRAWLSGETRERQLAFWRKHLGGDGELPVLALPADRPRPALWDGVGAHAMLRVPAEVVDGLRELGRREGTTLFMTLLAAYFAWLSRASGQEDFVVGTPVANRQLPETEGMVGFFVNTLAIRERVTGAMPFRALLARVRADCLAAFAHQEMPFESVVEALAPRRDLSRTPVYQTMLVLQHAAAAELRLPGLAIEAEALENPTAKCELTLNLTERGRELEGAWEYGSALFAPETVRRWSEDFSGMLATLARSAADVRVGALYQPTAEVARKLFVEWQGRADEKMSDASVPRQVARWVKETPEAFAVSDGRETLNYRELDARAERLARRLAGLLRHGRGEAVVAVCLERSVEWVVALLAVWKVGAAYLPLDPRQPAARLAAMAADATAAVVITRRERAEIFSGREILCVDDGTAAGGPLRERREEGALQLPTIPALTRRATNAEPDQLAYVIYTSGSTGRPKGVMISHRNLAHLVHWHRRAFEVTRADVATQLAGLGFDAAVWEVWPYLASGAGLHLVPAETVAAPEALRDFLVERGVTVSFLPTPLAEACLGLAWPASVRLRYMLTGGDRLHAPPPESLPFVLVNNYGPTESTVVATSGAVAATRTNRAPSIGRPIDHTRAYVLDAALNAVPPGAPGELCVAGGSLARGYLGRADLTAERFWPDPFSTEPGARLYRTGDLVRFGGDGELEFIGRSDAQVKIRGVRIEPGEIEAALQQEPEVAEAVVVTRTAGNGDTQLIAYVVRRPGAAEVRVSLRERLKARLPEAMVPAQVVALPALPLTPNGKVDRRALPEPMEDEAGAASFLAPRAGLEAMIAAVWCEVLGRTKVGARDNFFDVGGHSLLILKMQTALQKKLGCEIPVVELFAHPTVAAQAERFGGGAGAAVAAARTEAAARGAQQRAARERLKAVKR